ncbi:MAG: UDP-3-O-(3-hydroxymyristoyl)glucosamine N-acyltransferase [Candidatus Cloacimonetes bacterium]|nr:UDP-3-O-(3-hydroxymyristoyl)glucosamine N-acyltransferase [Candidatus Cloacimonadota bacterium]
MKVFNNDINLSIILKIIEKHCLSTVDDNLPLTFNNVSELAEANHESICFYENKKYLNDFQNSQAGLIFIPINDPCILPVANMSLNTDTQLVTHEKNIDTLQKNKNQLLIKVDKPYLAFMTLVAWWLNEDEKNSIKTISDQTAIHYSANIGKNVHISPFAVIEENVSIGDNSYIGASTVIMKGSTIGSNCKIYPSVTIYNDCKVGNHVIIHAGAVIGADGFGFIEINGSQFKIPQVGNVVIENDVEIGANTTIDRSTIGTTKIKSNTKIDNLVQIGHNCNIDESSILCSQVGLAGNTSIGKNVYLAGQVGVAGHLTIHDRTMVGAQSGVPGDLQTGKYFGYPALPAFEQKKIMMSLRDLPNVVRFVKKLMKKEENSE